MFNERPSKTYDVEDPFASYLLDRGIYRWGTYVENKMDEAEAAIRNSMRNRKGTETFVLSSRQATFNKLMGITDITNVYKQPQIPSQKSISAEGDFNFQSFNERDTK